jgi:mannosyl-oligosaccharide glucosidase
MRDQAYYAKSKFGHDFNAVFRPSKRWLEKGDIKFPQSLFSNLMGGIGYFYGDDRINNPRTSSTQPSSSDTYELFTMVPSRSFFPRGFLWDEGFHLLVVINWDLDLALEILQNWFALMNEDGWIAREQILGPEARSKVPEEFQIQDKDYANPPTLFLVVETFLDMVAGKKSYRGATTKQLDHRFATSFLIQLYPKLKKHYEWWSKTQREDSSYLSDGSHVYYGYRWKGQTATHILTSGLDDYPRTNPPGPHDLHVDALSWVGLMANVLRKTADYLEEHQDSAIFRKQKEDIDSSMEFLHWSEDERAYCDTTKVNGLLVHECHKGYVSLLPFLVGSWNASHPHLDATLNLMRDESHLWNTYGLRSLSLSDKFYGTDENYWRGPIWININYLAIVKLLVSPTFLANTKKEINDMNRNSRKHMVLTKP